MRSSPWTRRSLAYVTQTTLSVDDTKDIVTALRTALPAPGNEPRKDDICYATTNRQEAVKAIAAEAQLVLVIGAANSSNSVRLKEVAERSGAKAAATSSATRTTGRRSSQTPGPRRSSTTGVRTT